MTTTTSKYAKVSFLAAGHVVQDILITDPRYTAEQISDMLESGEAITTVQEGETVCLTTGDWDVIGEVVYTESELEYNEFILEDDYELVVELKEEKPFNASRMALAGAVGEFIYEPEMSVEEVMTELKKVGDGYPYSLTMEPSCGDMTANQILREIELFAEGLTNLMRAAYDAGKNGQEFI
jgi:hypothetical protein